MAQRTDDINAIAPTTPTTAYTHVLLDLPLEEDRGGGGGVDGGGDGSEV